MARRNTFQMIFAKLDKVGALRILDAGQDYAKSKSGGYMDLNLDVIERGEESSVIALSHYYEQNGDMVADPDMTLRIYHESMMAEALTFQDSFGYQVVYPAPGRVYPRHKKELNAFLNKWLTNAINQGHQFNTGA